MQRRPTPSPPPASRPSRSPRRRASPSSTAPTACSGCSRSPSHDLAVLLHDRRHRRGDERRGACSAPTPSSPPTCRRCARSSARRQRARTCARCSPARRSSPATPARSARACRTPTRCAAPRRCTAPPATPLGHAAHRRRRASWRAPSTTPCVTLDGRVESNGNFHGAPVGYVLDFLAIAVADVASDVRAPHRPLPRPCAQPGPAAVPRARGRRRLRPDDRAVHGGRDRVAS